MTQDHEDLLTDFAHIAAGLVEAEVQKAVEPLRRELVASNAKVAALTEQVASFTATRPFAGSILDFPRTPVFGNGGSLDRLLPSQ